MKRTYKAIVAVTALLVAIAVAEEFRSPVVFKNDVDFDTGANLKIQGTKVTSTAAELNIMDGVTVTAAQINSAGGGTTATLTPTMVSNLNANVVCSNLVVTTGGTVTVPADAISIDAVNGITVTASAINAAGNGTTATITPTMVSNLNANVVCSNLVVTTGGTVILPSASLASAALPATIANSTTVSNQNLFVYGSNITARSGGTVTMAGTMVFSGLPTSTNTFSVSGTAWNSNGYVCVWTP